MALEKDFQAKIVKYLKSKKCMVFKMQMNATTKAGTPDLFFVKEGFWGAIEVKKSKTAKLRPGQKENVEKMNEWSWAKIVYPENFEETKKELEQILI